MSSPVPPPLPAELDALLRRMRLPHMRRTAPEVLATARAQRWEPAEVLRTLLAAEATGRERSSRATRRAAAGFPTGKTFAAWDEQASSIPPPTQAALRTLEWVGRRENLVVCGPSGTGKTFFLEALGQTAVQAGSKVAWFSLESLGTLVRRHRADDSVTKAVTRILRADLVVVDDIGLLPVGPDAAEGLYRLVDAAYERRSVAVSSNLHPAKAHRFPATCARWDRAFTGSGGRAAVPAVAIIGRAARRSRRQLRSVGPDRVVVARWCWLVTVRARRRSGGSPWGWDPRGPGPG